MNVRMQSNAALGSNAPTPPRNYPFPTRLLPGVVLACDSIASLLSACFAFLFVEFYAGMAETYVTAMLFVWICGTLLFSVGGLYRFDSIMQPLESLDKLVVAVGTTFLLLLAAAFSLKISAEFSRLWMGLFFAGCVAGPLLVRLSASWSVSRLAAMRLISRNVAILGGVEQCTRLLEDIATTRPGFLSVVGVFHAAPSDARSVAGHSVWGGVEDLAAFARQHRLDDIIVALPWTGERALPEVVAGLRELPSHIYISPDLAGFQPELRQPPSHFGELPVLEVAGKPLSGWDIVVKALEDYGLGIVIAVLLLPILLLIAIAIRFDSPGPALFRQKRLGFNNRVFEIYKFRTMRHALRPEEKTVQATRDDPRVTRVGRILRRLSLDELPQILNVLNGTMSLVGPRPHAVDHNEDYAREIHGYFARHRVKPGITGLAQIRGLRGEADVDRMKVRVEHDVAYAESWSFLLDMKILALTLVAIVIGRNAY